MSLSCLRLRFLMLFGIAFFGYMLVAIGNQVATGRLPDNAPWRLLAAAAIGLLLVGILVLLAGGLTARVLTDDDGVHLAWFSRRKTFRWYEIDNITLARNGRFWVVYLHTSTGRHRIAGLMCPIWFSLQFGNQEYAEPPRSTPGSLRKPYLRLREEWLRRRSAAAA